jgi:integrase/recombinase XerD
MTSDEPVEGELVPIPPGPGGLATREPPKRDILCEAWLTAQKAHLTRVAYRLDIKTYFEFCDSIGRDPLNTFRLTVDQYRAELKDQNYAASTIARKLSSVSSFYAYCVTEAGSVVTSNPVANVKRPDVSDESETRGLTPDEVDALIDGCIATGTPHAIVIRLMIDTGLRVSEACGITTRDIEYEGGTMVVRVTRKGEKRQRIPVPDDVAKAIREMIGTRRGPVFVGKRNAVLTGARIAEALQEIARESGVEGRVHPHMLRHAAATQLLNDGVSLREVQDLLGHTDPKTTYRYDRARRRVVDSPVHRLAALRRSRKEDHANP